MKFPHLCPWQSRLMEKKIRDQAFTELYYPLLSFDSPLLGDSTPISTEVNDEPPKNNNRRPPIS